MKIVWAHDNDTGRTYTEPNWKTIHHGGDYSIGTLRPTPAQTDYTLASDLSTGNGHSHTFIR